MPSSVQLAALAASALVAACVVLWFAKRARVDTVRVVHGDPEALGEAAPRAPRLAPVSSSALHAFDAQRPIFPPSAFQRRPIDLKQLTLLFPGQGGNTEYDPQDYFHPLGSAEFTLRFPEHPNSPLAIRTNAYGHKTSAPLRDARAELRVFVAGDSHANGVCEGEETFAARLEQRLIAAGRDGEVINAAWGGYSFLHYLGSLERHLVLQPDIAVMAAYGGNDFHEVLQIHHWMAGTTRPWKGPEYRAHVEDGALIHNGAVYQGFFALSYFAEHPDQVEVALQVARDVSLEFAITCWRHAIHPIFVYIPPAHEVEWDEHRDTFEAVREHFGLDAHELELFRRMGDSYLAYLRSLRVDVVDMRPTFVRRERKYYWKDDLHIALDAHDSIAAELEPLVQAARPRGAQRVRLAVDPPAAGALLSHGAARSAPARLPFATAQSRSAGSPLVELKDDAWRLDWPSESERAALYTLTGLHRADSNPLFTYRTGLGPQPNAPAFSTNALAFVWGSDGKAPRTKPRVVLLGDETVFGPTSIGEPCGALVEARLEVECMDATTLGHGPLQYLGMAHSLARVKPEVVLLQWSPGDLLEGGTSEERLLALRNAGERESDGGRGPLDLSLPITPEQVESHWTEQPPGVRSALESSLRAVLELARRCRAMGAELGVVVVPHALDPRAATVDAADGPRRVRALLDGATGSFVRTLRFHGIDIVELAELSALGPEHFEPDERLSAAGRARLAEVLADRAAALLDRYARWR